MKITIHDYLSHNLSCRFLSTIDNYNFFKSNYLRLSIPFLNSFIKVKINKRTINLLQYSINKRIINFVNLFRKKLIAFQLTLYREGARNLALI